MALPLPDQIVFGPVRSRRFGVSLGVNLLPPTLRVCNLNCAYCQYSRTRAESRDRRHTVGWPTPERVETAVADRLLRAAAGNELIDRITIAGRGEPTLHPEFAQIVARLCTVRDRIAPAIPIAVHSNSTTCMYDDIREGLHRLDERYMKLDGGDPLTVRMINGSRLAVETIVNGLMALGPLTLQSMFVGDATGRIDNIGDGAVNEWLLAVERVRPLAVHIYTVGRVPARGSLRHVPSWRLREIAEHVRAYGIQARVLS